MKKYYVLLILLISGSLWAGNSLTSAFEYLRTDFNPRTAALGNAFTTLRGDVNGLFLNPAGMAYSENRHYAFNYTSYLLDINAGVAAYSQRVEGVGILSAAITYVDYGEFKETDEFARETGQSFSPLDFALTLSWADRFEKNFSYGVNLKYAFSKIQDYNASALALDLGLIWESTFQKDLFFAFSLLNVGSNLEYYANTQEDLPLSMRIGVSKILEHLPLEIGFSFTNFNLDADSFTDRLKRFSIGGEFRLSESLRLRLGYDNQLHSDLKALEESEFGGLSGGLGIYVKSFRFDYSYSNYNLLGNTHRFGLTGVID